MCKNFHDVLFFKMAEWTDCLYEQNEAQKQKKWMYVICRLLSLFLCICALCVCAAIGSCFSFMQRLYMWCHRQYNVVWWTSGTTSAEISFSIPIEMCRTSKPWWIVPKNVFASMFRNGAGSFFPLLHIQFVLQIIISYLTFNTLGEIAGCIQNL